MDHDDPITRFFPDDEDVDLYQVLGVKEDAKSDDIRKAYRKLALKHHPDKHAGADEDAKADASLKFQQLGFAYAVLSDEKKRSRYDMTGKTDEGFDFGPGEDGWEAYFEELFEEVTKSKLDESKKDYQGSAEEINDLKKAYVDTDGSIAEIITYIPHSTIDDEARFIIIISDLVKKGDLPLFPQWESSTKDEKAKLIRKKQADKEAAEAEALAKELGVWDEFYGSGKTGPRKGKGKGKGKEKQSADDEEDTSALQALILKKQKNMDSFFDNLAAKYAEPQKDSRAGKKGKKRGKADDDGEGISETSPRKKSKKGEPPHPDIDDAEFEQIQQRLMEGNAKQRVDGASVKSRTTKGRKGK